MEEKMKDLELDYYDITGVGMEWDDVDKVIMPAFRLEKMDNKSKAVRLLLEGYIERNPKKLLTGLYNVIYWLQKKG